MSGEAKPEVSNNGITINIENKQIRRAGFPNHIHLSPMQTELMAMYLKHMPRPLHNERVIAIRWSERDDPMTNVKVFVAQVNVRLAALNLALRRAPSFGYYLVDAEHPRAQLICDRAEAIREAVGA